MESNIKIKIENFRKEIAITTFDKAFKEKLEGLYDNEYRDNMEYKVDDARYKILELSKMNLKLIQILISKGILGDSEISEIMEDSITII